MVAETGFVRNTWVQPPGTQPRGEYYQLALDEVDELVKLIFQIEHINPPFFWLGDDAKRYLNYQNKFPLFEQK